MSDIKALVIKNELQLEQDKVNQLLSLISGRSGNSISFMSPEREAGPFLLYCCGDDLQTIATKTSWPLDVVLLTAIHYKWPEKAKSLQRDLTSKNIADLQKDITKMLLVATYITMQKELGDVISGRMDGSKSGLVPKNLQGLEKLMTMINDTLNPQPKEPTTGKSGMATTNITAQNVQVVQGTSPKEINATEEPEDPAKKAARDAKLKALEGL